MFARFFRSDAMSETYGETDDVTFEAESFQLTYHELRSGADGDFLANFDAIDDAWYIKGVPYSDCVIYVTDDLATQTAQMDKALAHVTDEMVLKALDDES